MARVINRSSTFTILRPFEGLALFTQFVNGEQMKAATIDGEMEISVDMDVAGGDWHISDVWISVDNGRLGAESREAKINLNADDHERYYLLVLDAIMDRYETWIEDLVQDELSEARYVRGHIRAA